MLAPHIKQWVLDGPAACGRLRANWTYADLADHLWQSERIKASRRTVCNLCHKHGIKPYRPTYRVLRGDPRKLLPSTPRQRWKKSISHTQRMQRAFARHIRDVGRIYPVAYFPHVVMTVDNETWHRGKRVEAALAKVPHVQPYRLPSQPAPQGRRATVAGNLHVQLQSDEHGLANSVRWFKREYFAANVILDQTASQM